MSLESELDSHPGWKWCTSEGAELHTLLLGLKSSLREKIQWLEEAESLTLRMRESGAVVREDTVSAPRTPVMNQPAPPVA